MFKLDEKRVVEFNNKSYETWHGSPFDRGSADSYYGRGAKAHWYPEGTGRGEAITEERMSAAEIEAYYAGYDHNERFGDKKNWY
jgi:hypothetical protein